MHIQAILGSLNILKVWKQQITAYLGVNSKLDFIPLTESVGDIHQ